MSERSTAWSEYLAAAHRLDTVRREAADAAAGEASALAAARDELPTVQARLTMQAATLVDAADRAGTPAPVLQPGPAEMHDAAQAVAGGPAVALAALRQAVAHVDVADGALARLDDEGTGPQALRNLLVYGPLALVAMLVQLAVAGLAEPDAQLFFAAVCGLVLAPLALGAGWLVTGMVYPERSRTPQVGALVCVAPALLVVLLLALL
ncbi:hypothetical protein CS0771_10750 [Catellatospora sp. IY07-71]|uniref:hypothetical protein n=1 Tax=Catellatospora sp. IY07-71 TaxID=2728827 RepID=UPI001BB35CFB|nr:hypothetical protein [Catellatospora sp. IY07-71]BCJ71531.1 hypothetical protein CS0771_10750 [Catellatospora sp. IY07-71]